MTCALFLPGRLTQKTSRRWKLPSANIGDGLPMCPKSRTLLRERPWPELMCSWCRALSSRRQSGCDARCSRGPFRSSLRVRVSFNSCAIGSRHGARATVLFFVRARWTACWMAAGRRLGFWMIQQHRETLRKRCSSVRIFRWRLKRELMSSSSSTFLAQKRPLWQREARRLGRGSQHRFCLGLMKRAFS